MSPRDTATPKQSQSPRSNPWTSAFSIIVICVVGGVLLFNLLSSFSRRAHRGDCANNLKQIGIALYAYQEQYGSFPPAYVADETGKPMHSWRTLILPFLDQSRSAHPLPTKYSFHEPWDGPHNYPLANEVPRSKWLGYFHCWGDPDHEFETSYLAVVGPDTAWPSGELMSLDKIRSPSDTILVVEVFDSHIKWSEPKDLTVAEAAKRIRPDQHEVIHTGVAQVLYADGSVGELTTEMIQSPDFAKRFSIEYESDPQDDGPLF